MTLAGLIIAHLMRIRLLLLLLLLLLLKYYDDVGAALNQINARQQQSRGARKREIR